MAIEPIPKIYQKLKENRVCQTINGCIANQPGKAKFIEVEGGPNMLSTLAVNNVGLTARRIRKNAKRHNANVKEIEVECYDIKSVAEKSGIKSVDFLSLDTEGGELEILKSINFQKLPITLISVENNFYTPDIRIYLESQGFIYLGTFKVDEIYININPKLEFNFLFFDARKVLNLNFLKMNKRIHLMQLLGYSSIIFCI